MKDSNDAQQAKDWTLAAKNAAGTALHLVQASKTLSQPAGRR